MNSSLSIDRMWMKNEENALWTGFASVRIAELAR